MKTFFLFLFGLFITTLCFTTNAKASDQEPQELYEENCAACHGLRGHGDGPLAGKLDIPPADLEETIVKDGATDEFLHWTIREGGVQMHTDMPSFKDSHSVDSEQAGLIIEYLRSLYRR